MAPKTEGEYSPLPGKKVWDGGEIILASGCHIPECHTQLSKYPQMKALLEAFTQEYQGEFPRVCLYSMDESPAAGTKWGSGLARQNARSLLFSSFFPSLFLSSRGG